MENETLSRALSKVFSLPAEDRDLRRNMRSMFLVLAVAMQLSGNPLGERDSPQWVIRKKPQALCLRLFRIIQCGRWDLNPHDVSITRSLVLLVCQFRHFRIPSSSLSRRLVYNSKVCGFRQHPFFIFFKNFFLLFQNVIYRKLTTHPLNQPDPCKNPQLQALCTYPCPSYH